MSQMRKKILSLLLTVMMLFTSIPFSVLAADEESRAFWAGAMNFNNANNYVTTVKSMTASNMTQMKWAYPLNATEISGGAYYAGQSVIVDGYLYATGGGKLHKVDIETGIGTIINEQAGNTTSYYDYLCYADGILILTTQDSLAAYSTDGECIGSVSGTYGYYHPVQYHEGYVFCNGFIYKMEKTDNSVTFLAVGDKAIGDDAFNWSSGAFYNDLFYVASKTTVYAVDYKTNTVIDSYVFDAERTAKNNVQPGICLDEESGRLYWGTYDYDSYIHSIAIDITDGEAKGNFISESYISADASQKSVATPIVYGGRIYLAGQQGKMTVLSAKNLTKLYDVSIGGGRVQGTPILSAVDGKIRIYIQCYNGHLYMFTDNGESGTSVKLAETENYTKVQYPYAFEQYSMDESGNIYCYNESGYLFCFGISECEVPSIDTDLSEKQVKIEKETEAPALEVEASVGDGGELSYQWQMCEDEINWNDIKDATSDSFIPSTDREGIYFYRCVITNTNGDKKAYVKSSVAKILVKVFSSDTTLNVLVNGSNTITSSNPQIATNGKDNVLYVTNRSQKVTNIWLGTISDAKVSSFEILHGLKASAAMPKFTSKSTGNTYDGVTYSGYYRSSDYILPIVAKAEVTAEDGKAKATHYIVIDSDEAGEYVISVNALTCEDKTYFDEEQGLLFTQADQSAVLVADSETIALGETKKGEWIWSSSDLTVAKVDENGKVTSVGGGSATITASCGRISATCKVTSTAPLHSVHSYVNGKCSICTMNEPGAVSAKFTLTDQAGNIAISEDGTTQIYKTDISVNDADFDGKLTLNDAFIVLHTEHSKNGAEDFLSAGGYMSKLWGVTTYNIGYLVNNTVACNLLDGIFPGDEISAFFYIDTTDYSDLYTYFEDESVTISVNNDEAFCVKGLAVMSNSAAVPEGASINVFKENGEEVTSLATKADKDGKFNLSFPEAGIYTLQVSESCSYTGSVWDNEIKDYADKAFPSAPIVLSRMQVVVMPYAEATVYVTISDEKGKFSVGKNGEEMYRFPVKATDNPDEPDGKVSILEVIIATHEQYHPDGKSAFSATNGRYGWSIEKLWGVNNGGNVGYYFNDICLLGSGTKSGTNNREFEDKLLDTIVENGDSYNIYALQDTKKWTDMYTYVDPVSQSAIAGQGKTFTVKGDSFGLSKIPEGASVTITDSKGEIQTTLNTTIDKNATFTVTFPTSGVYTAEIGSSAEHYYVPSRCIIYVNSASSGNPDTTDEDYAYIRVKDPNGKTYKEKTRYAIEDGETAYSLLLKTGLKVKSTTEYQYGGVYIESIEGLGEFDKGETSGWMYNVNGSFPEYSASLYELSDGDYVEWVYTRNLGGDIGDNSYSGSSSKKVKKEENTEENPASEQTSTTCPFSDALNHWAYEAIEYVYNKNIMQGTSNATFAPDTNMTRAMLVTVLHRLENAEITNSNNKFTDVPIDRWYTDAVVWATSNSIVNGISENQFAPDADISREEMATILYRYAKMKGYEVNEFANLSQYSDINEIDSWALDAIKWANKKGLINGTSDKTLSPNQKATRAQLCTILMRFCENIAK